MTCYVLYSYGASYQEGVTLTTPEMGLESIGAGFSPPNAPSISVSTSVPFTRGGNIYVGTPDGVDQFYEKTFDVSVDDYKQITEPTGLYYGLVNGNCMDGLSITEPDDANSVILSYSPPTPPSIVYDVALPDGPTMGLVDIAIPGNDTNTDIIKVLPALFDTIKDGVIGISEDILANISTDALQSYNDKVFNTALTSCLTLRGIDAPAASDAVVLASRHRSEIARDLLILSKTANNSTAGVGAILGLKSSEYTAHMEAQQAKLDNAKLDTELAIQNIVMMFLLYNAEVLSAQSQYHEYGQITEIELKKLELYKKEIRSAGKAMDGNTQLVQAYRKQLSVVQQVFESFEQSMKLSEMTLKLVTAEINVETLNIETNTKIIEGLADQSKNLAYQSETWGKAHGIETDAQVTRQSANLAADKVSLARSILNLEKSSKNDVISSENSVLSALANSVSTKMRSVEQMFELDNMTNYNSVALQAESSHYSAELKQAEQDILSRSTTLKLQGKVNAENNKENITSAKITASYAKATALEMSLNDKFDASEILRVANTKQKLIHTISTGA